MRSQTIKPVDIEPFTAEISVSGKMETWEIFQCYLERKGGVAIWCGRREKAKDEYRYMDFLPVEVGQQQFRKGA